ncbi:putative uncharacterized protein [Ruminococcus sp. CAG:403]|nr:putative uncharacterized protein [Ruminococcus sp. CAG:403]
MKKVFELEDLDCANCAAKMEDAIRKLDGVQSVTISFMAQKMTLEAEDANFDKVLKQVKKCIKRVEPDCVVVD